MFENFSELMDDSQNGEILKQDENILNGESEISQQEGEMVGRGEHSSEAVANAWRDYDRMSDSQKESFLRGRSRNAHILNLEMRKERAGSTTGEAEVTETSENGETVGYSSKYYESQMASALEKGNQIAYKNARANWAKAKVKESVGSTTGEGETREVSEAAEEKEAVGYSSSHYEHEMSVALKNGNKIAYDNARSNWAKAKAKEATG